jgi:hypothetical protein
MISGWLGVNVAALLAVHGHAAVVVLLEGRLLLRHVGYRWQLLEAVLGGPLSLFLGGLLGLPGHVAGDGHVRLDGRLGKDSLAGVLVDSVADLAACADGLIACQLLAAAHGICLMGCLLGGLEGCLLGGLESSLLGGLESCLSFRGLES